MFRMEELTKRGPLPLGVYVLEGETGLQAGRQSAKAPSIANSFIHSFCSLQSTHQGAPLQPTLKKKNHASLLKTPPWLSTALRINPKCTRNSNSLSYLAAISSSWPTCPPALPSVLSSHTGWLPSLLTSSLLLGVFLHRQPSA